jgi:hypothetical protein
METAKSIRSHGINTSRPPADSRTVKPGPAAATTTGKSRFLPSRLVNVAAATTPASPASPATTSPITNENAEGKRRRKQTKTRCMKQKKEGNHFEKS